MLKALDLVRLTLISDHFFGILNETNEFFGFSVVYTKTFIRLSVDESGEYLPRRLYFGE